MNRSDHDILIYLWSTEDSKSIPVGALSPLSDIHDENWVYHYHADFLKNNICRYFDPFFKLIKQHTETFNRETHFSVFTDSIPDEWGQNLYRQAVKSKIITVDNFQHSSLEKSISVDYLQHNESFILASLLLLVTDPLRKGAMRFKTSEAGPFLEHDTLKAVPRIDYLDVIEAGIHVLEKDEESAESEHTLKTLLAPAASLGGSRPKCSVLDNNDQLWIAKCPSIKDQIDKGAWEYLIWLLAKQSGLDVPDAGLQKGTQDHHIFLSKRFDRRGHHRIHFISANTAVRMISQSDHQYPPGYLHLAEFIQFHGKEPQKDLPELWRRLLFNLSISNHDDHLNNHGFLLTENGWKLAPAFDLNPASLASKGKKALSIQHGTSKRDLDSAFRVGKYMQLNSKEMNMISEEVYEAVSTWRKKAAQLDIKSDEIKAMNRSFILPKKHRPVSDKTQATQPNVKRSFFRDLKSNRGKNKPKDP